MGLLWYDAQSNVTYSEQVDNRHSYFSKATSHAVRVI